MSTVTAPLHGRAQERSEALVRHGVIAWLTNTNHKRVGLLYVVSSIAFFGVAGILADAIRSQLAVPNNGIIGPHAYNQIFTLHGTAMIFMVITPFALGLANYIVPIQCGAPDMAFPRLNLTSYYFFVLGALTVLLGAATDGGAGASGWTSYAPLSEVKIGMGYGQDMWFIGLFLMSASSIMTAINLLVTVFLFRAPGMTMWRISIFTWEMIATSLLILLAFPPLTSVFAMCLMDRHMGAHFFDATAGGDPILYQHLWWFFGHPEVYVMILPFFGIVSEIVATFSRKPIFGYLGLVLSAFAIAGLSMGVWAHHMFTTGAVVDPFFAAGSFLIAVPTGVKFFNWIATMWRGTIEYTTAMLYIVGFMLNFLIGGITGVMVASPPIDFQARDSYFLVAHFHYTIGGGSLFAILGAIYFWFPKIYGKLLNERLGKLSFAFMFVGFNCTFISMLFLGISGMVRRIYTYPSIHDWPLLNALASFGALLMTVAVSLVVYDIFWTLRYGQRCGDNPWGGYSLEWATSSPPPEYNFERLPVIRSERPAWDIEHPEEAKVRTGMLSHEE